MIRHIENSISPKTIRTNNKFAGYKNTYNSMHFNNIMKNKMFGKGREKKWKGRKGKGRKGLNCMQWQT
jgi:hypothetical protein